VADVVNDASIADADPGPTNAVAIATGPGKDEDPSILRAKDGTFFLAWYSNRDGGDRIWLMTSADGLTWGTPRAITDASEHAFYPGLLQTRDGRFHLSWWAGEVGDGGTLVGRIRYASSDDTQAWSAPVSLTDAAGLAWGATMTEPSAGEIVMAWSSNASGDKDLYTAISTNGGAAWSVPARRVDAAFNDDLPFITTKADGSLVMTWQRYDASVTDFGAAFGDPSNELVYATSVDGASWSAPIALTNDPDGGHVPDVIASLFPSSDPSGFSVAWSSVRLGSTTGNVYAMGLSTGLASITQLTTEGGYSGRLVPTGTSGRSILVWVKDLDIWSRRL